MEATFYLSAAVAVAATLMVVTRASAVHALLYLIVSLLAVAVVFFVLGAPFVAALEVIIYAGAVMVLFVFVIMMLNLGKAAAVKEREWLSPGMWMGPAILSALLLAELIYILMGNEGAAIAGRAAVDSREVGITLFGPYLLGVELASLLLLAGLVGACHLGWHTESGWGSRSEPLSDRRGHEHG
ncbi:NADH dehydrogenase subunit J [Nitrosospira sp. Nsp2]|uniref:NADH-quinone oxidoreductase subunit J n=1 Tax=Nitrosospira sp. Nsp2 TaxID=136548 RepID=UPI000D47F168|nr:NADH-quinone oxidoreductase subunit J [Nitrosospira sp. Nsp2]PTR17528.1 NADH dehydrogenase subunit J [Nitrosospira sp. Nsp2]